MSYQAAWNELKLSLLARGEYFFFGNHQEAERTIHFTLEKMKELEAKIPKLKLVRADSALKDRAGE